MTCIHGVAKEDGCSRGESIGVVRGKELGGGLTAQPSVYGRVPPQVINKATSHIFALRNEFYMRGRAGAYLII